MATTLRDIAQELSISPTLVSRVLNDKPGAWASETTRARIFETAARMNYQPSGAARALVTGKSMMIAVSAGDADWLHARSGRLAEMRGLIDAAARHQYKVLVLPSEKSTAERREFEGLVHSKGCDGFCLSAEQAEESLLAFLSEHHVPYVVIGNPGLPDVPRVDQDNYGLMHACTSWILNQGRRRIAAIQASPIPGEEPRSRPFGSLIAQGYEAALRESGLSMEPELTPERHWSNEAEVALWLCQVRPDALILRGLASVMLWRTGLARVGFSWPGDVLPVAQLEPAEFAYLEQAGLHHGFACQIHDPHAVGLKAGECLIDWIHGRPVPGLPILLPPAQPRFF